MSDDVVEIKDHLVQISSQLVELRASLRRVEEHLAIVEPHGVATPDELQSAVRMAIEETRATTPRHETAVERAAFSSVSSKAFDRRVLSNLIRKVLDEKRQ